MLATRAEEKDKNQKRKGTLLDLQNPQRSNLYSSQDSDSELILQFASKRLFGKHAPHSHISTKNDVDVMPEKKTYLLEHLK